MILMFSESLFYELFEVSKRNSEHTNKLLKSDWILYLDSFLVTRYLIDVHVCQQTTDMFV